MAGRVESVAPVLLGCLLVGNGVTARLTEVEAYDGTGVDAASHAHKGRTPRNGVMFGPPGHGYVYFTYGMHWCLNIVCREEGVASAVLVRAGSIVDGIDLARARRPGSRDRDLARGPARLTQALAITGAHNGVDLLAQDSPVRLLPGTEPATTSIQCGPRVGVVAEKDRPWRFWIEGEETVSPYRLHTPRVRRR
ncbi:MAG TPA: DNA-3-methyladenine glycosylase [Micromonosporaceae bacterium]